MSERPGDPTIEPVVPAPTPDPTAVPTPTPAPASPTVEAVPNHAHDPGVIYPGAIDPGAIYTEADEDVALGQTIAKIKAFKWPVLALAVVLGTIGGVYTYFKAPTWEAHSTLILIVPDLKSSSALTASLGLNQPSPLLLLQGVVKSRSELEYVSGKTGLKRIDLEKWLVADTDTPSNQLQISGTHKDKAMAIRIVNTAIDGLTLLNRDIGFSTAAKQVQYLRGTIVAREKELGQKQQALVNYQRRMTVPIDPNQPESAGLPLKQLREAQFELGSVTKSIQVTRNAVAASASALPDVPNTIPGINILRTRLNALELELRNLQIQLGDEAADVIYKRREIENTRNALKLETGRYLQSVQKNVDPRLAELEARRIILEDQITRLKPIAQAAPTEAVQFVRLFREVEGAAEGVKTLREAYERARTEAEVDKVRWSILDQPYLDDKPNNKNYTRNVAVGAIVGIFIGSVWAVRRRPL